MNVWRNHMIYSPLRYPGGKGKLASFMELIIQKVGCINGTYIEPFAGGAGIAINLLLNNVVSRIIINDLDKGIYSFWKAILTEPQRFISDIYSIPLNMEEWKKKKKIYMCESERYSYNLGFATFYLNRTNRSGIIKGGVIGGRKQDGNWKMDVRFNRQNLAARIQTIASQKNRIRIYNQDIDAFITRYMPKYIDNALIYFDPPYYEKGRELYMNFFRYEDHARIMAKIRQLENVKWIITYDYKPEILALYHDYECKRIKWSYSAAQKRSVDEIMIFHDPDMIPTKQELLAHKIHTTLQELSESKNLMGCGR